MCPWVMTCWVAFEGKVTPPLAKASRNSWSGVAAAKGAVATVMKANTVVANPAIAILMIPPVTSVNFAQERRN
jgi:hypothetical protein